MDPITDFFKTMQVSSIVHARLEVTAPWGLVREADPETAVGHRSSALAFSPSLLAHFGMVARGTCWLTVQGTEEPIPLTAGDSFLLSPGSTFALRDSPTTTLRSFCEASPKDGSTVIHYGGGGISATLLSGWIGFGETSLRALRRLLPPLILIRSDQAETLALRAALQLLASEVTAPAPGTEIMLNRLADVLFVLFVRAYIASGPHHRSSAWLRGVFDPQIGKALQAMHERVNTPWTVQTLAETAGLSRSGFALRFKELLTETPLEYLTNWRMYKAAALLQQDQIKLSEVAKSVGYDSNASFSKAFRRVMGSAPKQYVKQASTRSVGAIG